MVNTFRTNLFWLQYLYMFEIVSLGLSRNSDKGGVEFFLTRLKDELDTVDVDYCVRHIHCSLSPFGTFWLVGFFLSAFKVRRELKSVNGTILTRSLVVAVIVKLMKKRLLFIPSSQFRQIELRESGLLSRLNGKLASRFFSAVENYVVSSALSKNQVLFLSKKLKKDMGGDHCRQCYPGPLRSFAISSEYDMVRFLTVGRLAPIKGVLRAVKVLKDSKHEFIYNIVGTGSQLSEIKSVIKEDGRFRLFSPDQVDEAYKESNSYLFTSEYESFGHSILEALFSGLTIVYMPWTVKNTAIEEISDVAKKGFLPFHDIEFVDYDFNRECSREIDKVFNWNNFVRCVLQK